MQKLADQLIEELASEKSHFMEAAKCQKDAWLGNKSDRHPLLLSCSLDKEDINELPDYNLEEIHYDKDKMLIKGLIAMLGPKLGKAEAVPSIRANMGCGIFPTMFGIKQTLFPDKMPWVQEHLSKDELKAMGPDDIKISDDFKMGLEHMSYMADRLADTGCKVFPMDVQGTFDIAHIVYGDAIFYDLYDDPEFIHHLLELSCEAIFKGLAECFKVIPNSGEEIAHYNALVIPKSKGGVKISEDTSTLLSEEHIAEFITPYINKVLSHFGGGYVHYCGKNDHLLNAVLANEWVYGVNFGNPDMHDMEEVLQRCAQSEKVFYGKIPKQLTEITEDYFRKYVKAATFNNRCYLLMLYNCSRSEQELVYSDWAQVTSESLKG